MAIQRLFMPAFCMVAIQKAVEWPPGNDFELLKTLESLLHPHIWARCTNQALMCFGDGH
jgi:hypothetical protein